MLSPLDTLANITICGIYKVSFLLIRFPFERSGNAGMMSFSLEPTLRPRKSAEIYSFSRL